MSDVALGMRSASWAERVGTVGGTIADARSCGASRPRPPALPAPRGQGTEGNESPRRRQRSLASAVALSGRTTRSARYACRNRRSPSSDEFVPPDGTNSSFGRSGAAEDGEREARPQGLVPLGEQLAAQRRQRLRQTTSGSSQTTQAPRQPRRQ